MNAQIELAEKRAGIYWWFSTLFIRELNDAQLAELTGAAGTAFLDAFATEGMATEVEAVKAALVRAASAGDQRLELAADYAQTYLRDDRNSALPYASLYLSDEKLVYQQAQNEMTALLRQEGLAVDDALGEPADHIAVQLDYLGNLVLRDAGQSDAGEYRENLNLQLAFIDDRLRNWVPRFVQRSQRVQDADFYPAINDLFGAYLERDRDFLASQVV
jgi:TorA-specific chaperone